jgi:hypothetical protein
MNENGQKIYSVLFHIIVFINLFLVLHYHQHYIMCYLYSDKFLTEI